MSLDRIVDVDVHHCYEERADLVPYLQDDFVDRFLDSGGISIGGSGYGNNGGWRGVRADLRDESDNDITLITAGSPIDEIRETLLAGCDIDIAVLTGSNPFYTPSAMPDDSYANALCRAYNDYTIEHWLDRDDRFRYTLMVNHADPQSASEEIRRVGGHPGVVGVMMTPYASSPFGNPRNDPIFEAATDHDLTVTCHLGGGGGIFSYPPTAAGYPTHYVETRMTRHPQIQAHIASLIFNGAFERFPGLRFVSLEWGWSWIPAFLWRMDREWRADPDGFPEVEKPPSEYVTERIRFDTQPVEEPASNRHLEAIIDWMSGDEILMFASDFPHWDFDHPDHTLHSVSPEMRQRIFADNAVEAFAL